MSPKARVRAAWWLVVVSAVGMVANVVLYLADTITEADLLLVTLILSWLAITITAVDVLSTSDVRKEQDSAS